MPFSGPAEPVGLAKAPAKRQGASFPEGALDPDLPEALGSGDCIDLGSLPKDGGGPLQVEEIALLEVDEEEGRSRIGDEVAERVEVPVAREVRNSQGVSLEADEALFTAPVRDVHAAFGIVEMRGARHE